MQLSLTQLIPLSSPLLSSPLLSSPHSIIHTTTHITHYTTQRQRSIDIEAAHSQGLSESAAAMRTYEVRVPLVLFLVTL